ncbi:hypothetical protein QKO64_gp4 [Botrytis cinerea negative-stranded RNA virus 7]|uniref:Uncharacterized protein n=1 Tax=Botrytis cinerea negative-stranded RNA virus 7 TaxID=2731253 RepID=A0A7D5B9V2_9MONO|nr:hypothetical protein QKO64_gp4 [Botrytis cinerea negative-stranded RNA virus 7]QKW91271.1 hypothetical protein [Botrytis cinerea negative-stranded RNA virus 7]
MSYSGKSIEIINDDVDDLKKDEILQSQTNAKSALSLIQGKIKELELIESKPSEQSYRPDPIEIEVPITNFGNDPNIADIMIDSDDEDITPTLTRKSEPMIKMTKAEKKAEKRLQKKKGKATTSQSVVPDSQHHPDVPDSPIGKSWAEETMDPVDSPDPGSVTGIEQTMEEEVESDEDAFSADFSKEQLIDIVRTQHKTIEMRSSQIIRLNAKIDEILEYRDLQNNRMAKLERDLAQMMQSQKQIIKEFSQLQRFPASPPPPAPTPSVAMSIASDLDVGAAVEAYNNPDPTVFRRRVVFED